MTDRNGLTIQPAEVIDVTRQLDELGNRIQHVMATEAANLNVVASGRDEVSQQVAHTLNEVHESFTKASDQGVNEIHEVAATLRSHSGRIAEQDLG
jgi:phage-related minor tail protein